MALAVLFDPVPATTETRPLVMRTTVSMTSRSSSSLRVGDSPVVPQGTRPCMPWAIWNSTRPSKASTSTSPFLNGVTRAVNAPLNISLLQFKVLVEAPDRLLNLLRLYNTRYLNLRGRDHPDRDVRSPQRADHLRSVAGPVEHPRPHDTHLAKVFFPLDRAAQRSRDLARYRARLGEVGAADCEGNIRGSFPRAALDDDVHGDVGLGQGGENAAHRAGAGANAGQGDTRDVEVVDDTGQGFAGLQALQVFVLPDD